MQSETVAAREWLDSSEYWREVESTKVRLWRGNTVSTRRQLLEVVNDMDRCQHGICFTFCDNRAGTVM